MSALALARSEWRRLWVRPFAWILGAAVVAGMAWEFMLMLGQFLAQQVRLAAAGSGVGYTDLVTLPWLALFAVVAMLLVPLVSMSTLAGERRGGTLPLLFAAGLSPARIVLGKYLAVLGWLLLLLALLLTMPLVLAAFGAPDWGKLAAAVLGLVLTLATLAAIGIACSAHTAQPALAAAAALVVTAALVLVNRLALRDGVLGGAVNWLALPTHLQPLGRGLVSSVDVAWFVIVTAVALALAIRRLAVERAGD